MELSGRNFRGRELKYLNKLNKQKVAINTKEQYESTKVSPILNT